MKLFIRRDVSAGNSCFTVFDESGNEKYKAVFSSNRQNGSMSVFDNKKNVVLKIRKVPLVGTHTFAFKAGKSHITFVTVISQNNFHCNYYGSNWHLCGNVMSGNFSIIDVDNTVISSQIKYADYLELDVINNENELYCMATSICLNLINTVDKLAIQAV